MNAKVVVSAPGRLHFGLLRFHQPAGLSFGGMGVMIQSPRTVVELEAAEQWSAEGPDAERALSFARRALAAIGENGKPRSLSINVTSAIPSHRGLGGGTQLALSIAAGIRTLLGLSVGSAAELAAMVGRGQRSAVGSHGFIHGGLIWELGRRRGDVIGELTTRVAVSALWRVVLIAPRERHGLSGPPEQRAFESLPPVPDFTVERLIELAEGQILPAAERSSLDEFGEGVYEYGWLAGECFSSVQGGCYASPDVADCVREIRKLGVRGVGQSSWGPTVFAITESVERAQWLVEQLSQRQQFAQHNFQIAAVDNHGAVIKPTSRSFNPLPNPPHKGEGARSSHSNP